MLTLIRTEEFEQKVLKSDGLVLVDFWKPHCGPCEVLGTILEQVQAEFGDRISVLKMNAEESIDITVQYRITAAPTLLFVKGGQILDKYTGVFPKYKITSRVESLLS